MTSWKISILPHLVCFFEVTLKYVITGHNKACLVPNASFRRNFSKFGGHKRTFLLRSLMLPRGGKQKSHHSRGRLIWLIYGVSRFHLTFCAAELTSVSARGGETQNTAALKPLKPTHQHTFGTIIL